MANVPIDPSYISKLKNGEGTIIFTGITSAQTKANGFTIYLCDEADPKVARNAPLILTASFTKDSVNTVTLQYMVDGVKHGPAPSEENTEIYIETEFKLSFRVTKTQIEISCGVWTKQFSIGNSMEYAKHFVAVGDGLQSVNPPQFN